MIFALSTRRHRSCLWRSTDNTLKTLGNEECAGIPQTCKMFSAVSTGKRIVRGNLKICVFIKGLE